MNTTHRAKPRPKATPAPLTLALTALAALALATPFLPRARSARADVTGFAAFAPVNSTGKTTSVGFSADHAILTLTDGGKQEATSAYLSEPQPVAAWTASFTYQATQLGGGNGGPGGGDGIAFVLENDPRGPRALGGSGESLGYGGNLEGVQRSVGVTFNLFGDAGEAVTTNGTKALYGDTVPIDFRKGDPIRITLDCDGATIQETLHDLTTGETFTEVHAVDTSPLGGPTALVGFTGASGDATAVQTIRDFAFASRPAVPPTQQRRIAAVAPKAYNSLDSYVDPFIGTAGGGNTYPGAVAPFGMVQFSPDTRAHSIGYEYPNRQIEGFSLTHMSGVGCDDFGDVFLTATTGPVKTEVADYLSPFTHRHEVATPGYYKVLLAKPNVQAELTATLHAGVARFTFPAGTPANLLVPISHTLTFTDHATAQVVGNSEITGSVTSKSFCGSNQSYTVYFAMHLDQPFATYGTFNGPTQTAGGRSVSQTEKAPPVGAWVTFPASDKPRVVTARIGISFVDIAGARTNLDREVARHSFDDIHKQTAAAWEKALNVITVQGGTTAQKSIFYTSLYHCLLMPNVASDADGRYLGFDNKVHQIAPGHALYANFSGWDIYRTEAPLLALIAPDRMEDMCDSIALMYRQGGWIDRWPTANTYTNVMCGSPLTTLVATAWNYGLHDFDMPTAYEGMVKDATQLPPGGKPYLGQAHNNYFDTVGYIPDDKEGYGAVSQTEEDCIAYAALSSVAQSLGKSGDAARFRAKSLLYRNLFDPETKFLRPKLADGTWFAPFDPATEHGFVEGSGWHYRWMVPHDVAGLIHLFGGDDAFNTQLDAFFTYDKPAWRGNIYNPYNETDLEAPFLYDYSGKPSSTQTLVRKLLTQVYTTAPDGIPGNDDCGTMSAWCVWAMLGLYPTDPACPAFELCSPVFTRATLHLSAPYPGKTLTIDAPAASPENALIQSVQWNGTSLNGPWVPQTDLVRGGTLKFTLAPTANPTWGQAEATRPPSLSGAR